VLVRGDFMANPLATCQLKISQVPVCAISLVLVPFQGGYPLISQFTPKHLTPLAHLRHHPHATHIPTTHHPLLLYFPG